MGIGILRSENQREASHGLRFEAYELPKPALPPRIPIPHASSTELVPVPEPRYVEQVQSSALPSASDRGAMELKLRLDGVQKKWGRPTYSSPVSSTSNSTSQTQGNGATQADGVGAASSQHNRDVSYGSKKSQIEVDPEKQKLAASLFGGPSSRTEKRSSSTGQKTSRARSPAIKRSEVTATTVTSAVEKALPNPSPPPDLVDLEEPTPSNTPLVDPFKQLEGLVGPDEISSNFDSGNVGVGKSSDLLSLYDLPTSGWGTNSPNMPLNEVNLLSSAANPAIKNINGGSPHPSSQWKGPNSQVALEKHAAARQVGVTPSGTNPNLFRDLLG